MSLPESFSIVTVRENPFETAYQEEEQQEGRKRRRRRYRGWRIIDKPRWGNQDMGGLGQPAGAMLEWSVSRRVEKWIGMFWRMRAGFPLTLRCSLDAFVSIGVGLRGAVRGERGRKGDTADSEGAFVGAFLPRTWLGHGLASHCFSTDRGILRRSLYSCKIGVMHDIQEKQQGETKSGVSMLCVSATVGGNSSFST